MVFKSRRQQGYVMSHLKGFFINPESEDKIREREERELEEKPFSYDDYEDTPEGHYRAHVDFFVKTRGWSRKEAEHYVQSHYKRPKSVEGDE